MKGLRSVTNAPLLLCAVLFSGVQARLQPRLVGPIEIREDRHAVSQPLSPVKSEPGLSARNSNAVMSSFDADAGVSSAPMQPQRKAPTAPGSAPRSSAGARVLTTEGLSFDGIAQTGWSAPDSNGAVGAYQYVQWVNARFAVYNKATGNLVYGPMPGKTLWASFGGPCETTNLGDGIVQYDKLAYRWIMTRHAVGSSSGPYYQCFAVSTTDSATGSWYLYAFALSNHLTDYPKLGVWPDAYYLSTNLSDQNNHFAHVGALVCAFDRNAMLSGASARAVCFQAGTGEPSFLPSDIDGHRAPPPDSPNYFMSLDTHANSLDLYHFHVDFSNPSNSTFTGPTVMPVAPFTVACPGSGGVCIPQKGSVQTLDSLSDRLMYRLAYRRFLDHESLVVTHSVNPSTNAKAGIRWYEIRSPRASPFIYQQGTYAPDDTSRWMGSIAMDKQGNIAVGYSTSSNTMYPGISYTGRLASDPLGTLEGETSIMAGTGAQLPPDSQWGDYTSLSVDLGDDCTFWYTNEYLANIGTNNWRTRIASFRFTSCR